MKLRVWQQECITLALKKFKSGGKHFLGLATPGAGKTFMASALGETLYSNNEIDLVICLSPSSIVANDFKESLSTKFDACFDGKIGSLGQSLTYQNMQFLDSNFWSLFERYRVFVIFDEIHHCRGSSVEDANSWGEQIISNIKDKAKYSIALTGTPWRSDAAPIVLSQYCGITNEIECDYVYGLEKAITDNVCRVPQIIAIDNDKIT
jgi:superfamily II DNA or RNA helicase